jgi:hypothetical protein
VLTNTIFSTAVAYAWSQGYRVVLTNSVVPLLSVVASSRQRLHFRMATDTILLLGWSHLGIQVRPDISCCVQTPHNSSRNGCVRFLHPTLNSLTIAEHLMTDFGMGENRFLP